MGYVSPYGHLPAFPTGELYPIREEEGREKVAGNSSGTVKTMLY